MDASAVSLGEDRARQLADEEEDYDAEEEEGLPMGFGSGFQRRLAPQFGRHFGAAVNGQRAPAIIS